MAALEIGLDRIPFQTSTFPPQSLPFPGSVSKVPVISQDEVGNSIQEATSPGTGTVECCTAHWRNVLGGLGLPDSSSDWRSPGSTSDL